MYRREELNREGVPYSRCAPTWLIKDGVKKLFITQEEVDKAWKEGWSDGKKKRRK